MANAIHFNGTETLTHGFTVMDNAAFRAAFPGVKGVKSDGYSMRVARNAAGDLLPITRVIFRKSNPSNHKCGARCRHAKGGQCECECGGKFHGAGG